VLSQIFFQQRLTDLMLLGSLKDELQHCQRLNLAVQQLLRSWSAASARRNAPVMLDQAAMPWFAELNRSLKDPRLGDAAFRARIRASAAQLRRLAGEILARARADNADLGDCALPSLLEENIAGLPAGAQAGAMLFAALPDDSRTRRLPNFTERSSPVAPRARP